MRKLCVPCTRRSLSPPLRTPGYEASVERAKTARWSGTYDPSIHPRARHRHVQPTGFVRGAPNVLAQDVNTFSPLV